jgi:uncharacterized Zn ribbon protein
MKKNQLIFCPECGNQTTMKDLTYFGCTDCDGNHTTSSSRSDNIDAAILMESLGCSFTHTK